MSTTLYAITNSRPYEMNEQTAQEIRKGLGSLPLKRTKNHDGTIDMRNWEFEFDYFIDAPEDEDGITQIAWIDYYGGYALFPDVQRHLTAISSIYRYSLIYQNFKLDWFQSFRKELYSMVQLLGGTEVIFTAGDGTPHEEIFHDMVLEATYSYNEVKQAYIQRFGNPVTDYSLLDDSKLVYRRIQEFFLDDFLDLRG